MATNYDDIADEYQSSSDHPIKKYCEAFTFVKALGNIKGKAVLDLACGAGYYTRLIKQQGAARTVGVDISEKMLAFARQKERAVPLGLEYQIGDVSNLGQIGQFEVVTAVFLFPYAATRQALSAMFQTIHHNLKPGGKLVSITTTPTLSPADLTASEQYGISMAAESGLQDGTTITTTVARPNGHSFEMHTYYWQKNTYESVVAQAGFQKIRWRPIQVSKEGIRAYGQAYWQPYLTRPYSIILECYKS